MAPLQQRRDPPRNRHTNLPGRQPLPPVVQLALSRLQAVWVLFLEHRLRNGKHNSYLLCSTAQTSQ